MLAMAPEMRAPDMQETRQGQAEHAVVGLAGHAGRNRRDPVIGVPAGQDLASLGIAFGGMQKPQDLDHGVIRFGPRIRVKYPAARKRRHLHQFFAQQNRLVRHPPEKRVIPGELLVLPLRNLDQSGVVEPRHHVPQARIRIEIFAPMRVVDIGAAPMRHHDRAAFMYRRQVGEAVERVAIGLGFPGIGGGVAHGNLLQSMKGRLAGRRAGFNGGPNPLHACLGSKYPPRSVLRAKQ